MVTVSEILKSRMDEMHLTADQIADQCGVNRATVYRWLSGEIDNMKRSNIASLAKILDLDPALIVGSIDDESAEQASSRPVIPDFKTPKDAIRFLLEQPIIADYGGYDLNAMSDEEIIEFANEIASMIRFAAYQRQKKRKE